ncbi:MAG: response regulator, partial [Flavobacteriaceae bacterium]|nr:response regulator [Flavobacteriaceae bacterium]
MSKILIIEDEAAIRRVLKNILSEEEAGYEVFEAENGVEGLEMLSSQQFDLVLCDIKMPKMDGMETLKHLRNEFPEVSVVMISGHGDIDTAVECMRLGAYDYISKPPDLNRLLNTVRNALKNTNL